jgi:hypothetical protein
VKLRNLDQRAVETSKLNQTSSEVLLITASIDIRNTPFVTIRDSRERLSQYLMGVIAWIKLTKINTIVFCENSNTSYDFSKIIEFAKSEGKTLEVLVFSGNEGSQKYGKGYGYGKIIEYAIKNSAYLTDDTNFYLISGRLFIPEFDKIQELHADTPNIFKIPAFSPDKDPWANVSSAKPENFTQYIRAGLRFLYIFFGRGRGRGPHDYQSHVCLVFFKSNVKFFRKNLIHSYRRINDSKSYALEHTFYEDLASKQFSSFLIGYTFMGRSGSTGKSYDHDYPEEIRNLAESFLPEI